jgi:hypothetical protein
MTTTKHMATRHMTRSEQQRAFRRPRARCGGGIPASCWIVLATIMAWGCLPPAQDVECIEDANCGRFAGGACRTAPSGRHWCSYADSDCRSGYRYSDLDVGDDVGGQCTEVTYDLTVTVEGNGVGAVSSASGPMSGEGECSSGVCTRSFLEGTRVELAAEARSGAFLGWAQECRGPGACAVVMDRDRAATALFGTPGHPRWVKQVGGTGWDYGNGVAVDGDGNVIAVGSFSESLQIGGFTLTNAGYSDVFVAKLNGLTGEVIWAKRFGTVQSSAGGEAVRTDAANNIYVMGSFYGAVDFGGGELRSAGQDVFVLKLTSGGDHVWSRRFGGVRDETASAIAIRGDDIAFVGLFTQPTIIGSLIPAHLGSFSSDIYVVRMTTDGELIWSKSMGGADQDFVDDVALDSSGNVVIVGMFVGTVDFGGGPLSASGGDIYMAKYAGVNGAHLFSKRYGGMEGDGATSVAVDSTDNIIVAGHFKGSVDFGGPVPLGAVGESNIFVAKYTLAGAHLWARAFHATSATALTIQYPRSMVVNDAGDVVLAGEFRGTISFGGPELSSAAEWQTDIFAVRIAGAGGGHVSSIRAGSRASVTRIALGAADRLYLAGYFDVFAELGSKGLTPVNRDAFILALAPL